MFRTFSRSWELIKTSFAILREDKELIIFPIISMIAIALVSVTFAIPALLIGENQAAALVLLFLYYIVV